MIENLSSPTIRYSVVVPVYFNYESLPSLLLELRELNLRLKNALEVVFVVDGSPDQSYSWLENNLPLESFRYVLILLSRNFGSFSAVRAGLAEAQGLYYSVMAADLQEPPGLVLQFFEAMEVASADVVVGQRVARNDPPLTRIASNLYWKFYRLLVQPELPIGGVDIFGCNKKFRDCLISFQESNTSLISLIYWLGFRRINIEYERLPRLYGKSAWSFRKKFRYLADSIFAFSSFPISALFGFGILGTFFSVILGGAVLFAKISGAIEVPGYAATSLTVIFFGAINLIGIAIIGSYSWRAYENTKNRPGYIVMERSKNACK